MASLSVARMNSNPRKLITVNAALLFSFFIFFLFFQYLHTAVLGACLVKKTVSSFVVADAVG
jgi:hypothetical protein